ncbi:hypothetical protein NW752_008370 [Fusarium irregulare]|uniref:Extracellular membrane protein CFEM domain-containing protein n=1 Tax=Fusarium irregulare TaxID=2494466 RepID=A0A9W8PW39_9HYPO|nr:hypothetical protein NW752_008370 [Fusarium irregulare]KAJ4019391.1 hypothetical protein NW766_003110 [Fusarium irregulare]
MVRLLTTVAVLLSVAMSAQAAAFCQCLYSDGSHCCVDENTPAGCTATCENARALFADKPCNAGGKFSNVSPWNAQFRTACA